MNIDNINVIDYLKQANEEAAQSGVEFVGSVVSLSVQLMEHESLTLNQVRQVILDHPNIPDEWAPEALNKLTMYLKLASELNKTSSRSFDIPPDSPFYDNEDRFGGYIVQRLSKRQDDRIPTSHRVFYKEPKVGSVEGKVLKDISIDTSIVVSLKRIYGTSATDDTDSEFEIMVDSTECPDEDFHNYIPFLATLDRVFRERCVGRYSSTHIRELFIDVITKKVKAISVNPSQYFVDKENIDPVANLAESLNRIDAGIRVLDFVINKGVQGSIANRSFEAVSFGLSKTILKDINLLKAELAEMGERDNVRSKTWTKKSEELQALAKRLKAYKNKELITGDIIGDELRACNAIILKNI